DHTPSGGLEEQLRTLGLVYPGVYVGLARFLHARRAASEIGDARGPHLLGLGRRQQLASRGVQLIRPALEGVAHIGGRKPEQAVQAARQLGETSSRPQDEPTPAVMLHPDEARLRRQILWQDGH